MKKPLRFLGLHNVLCRLVILAVMFWLVACASHGAESESFAYSITATGTENVQSFPDQTFTWTVTATATETWKETVIKDVTASVHAQGTKDKTGEETATFVPARSARISVSYSGSSSGGWGVTVQLDGNRLFARTQFSSPSLGGNIDVIQGKTYLITATARDGACGISVAYPAQVTETRAASRTANYSAPASVNAMEGQKFLGPLPVAAYPRPQIGGVMSEPAFVISYNNERLTSRLDGANVYVSTAYIETSSVAWRKTETGSGTVSPGEGNKLITTSTFSAPNGDTRWSVEDDSLIIETWMTGNQLFGKSLQTARPPITWDGTPAHPADLNQDFRLAIGEITAYGAAWKTGQDWAVGPNPIPIAYITRAGTLWKEGEKYKFDPSVGAAPLWWVNDAAGALSAVAGRSHSAGAKVSTASSRITGASITISVQPASAVNVYAAEDTLPLGFSATNMSDGGTFDAVNRRVKWGPFFDNQARVLGYVLGPPAGFTGSATLRGTASFDGLDMAIGGDRQFTVFPPANPSTAVRTIQTFNGKFQVSIAAAPGSSVNTYALEEVLPANWTAAEISEGGAFDAASRKVKWGPFFDNQVRTLAYVLAPPAGFVGQIGLQGTASFNGTDLAVTGDASVTLSGAFVLEQPKLINGSFSVSFQTGLNQTYILQFRDSISEGAWKPVATVVGTGTIMTIVDPQPVGKQRFYRLLRRELAPAVTPPTISPEGLVSWWKLDEVSNGTQPVARRDSIGGNHLTDINTVLSGPGSGGIGADFEYDNSEYLIITDANQSGLDVKGSITLAAWIKWEGNATDTKCVLAKVDQGAQSSYRLCLSTLGVPFVAFSADGVSETQVSASSGILTNAWYHLSATLSEATVKLYLNGAEVASGTHAGGIFNSAAPFTIGNSFERGIVDQFFDGVISDAAIWNRALTPTEIQSLGPIPAVIVIISQPASLVLSPGATANFTVAATGTPPLRYQWRFEGLNLPGATDSSLVLSNVQSAREGNYSVVVSNAEGSVTSSNASLRVILNKAVTFDRILDGAPANEGGGSGIAWGDYNADGLEDLFLARGSNGAASPNSLYRNNGDGTFTKINSGVVVTDNEESLGGIWGDYDNDGHLDLFVHNVRGPNSLYHNNGNGTFNKVSQAPFTTDVGYCPGAAWGDYDNDGYIDLVVANANGNPFLYHNNRSGSFTRITTGPVVTDGIGSYGCFWGDYDNDGWLDLVVVRATGAETLSLYHNNQDSTFTRVPGGALASEVGGAMETAAWGDYDNDGDLDLLVSKAGAVGPVLFRNDGKGNFVKIPGTALAPGAGSQWAGGWEDYDNDGFLDIFTSQTNYLYRNNGDGTFERITGMHPVLEPANAGGLAWADFNQDGFPDLAVASVGGNTQLYSSVGNFNKWLKVKLFGRQSNSAAIGAQVRVTVRIDGVVRTMLRQVASGGAYGQPNSLVLNFGLGAAAKIDSVQVKWPSGTIQTISDTLPNQSIAVTELLR